MSNQALMVRKLPAGGSVSAGAQVSFALPLGRRYHQVALKYTGVTLAQMKKIECRLNGVTFQSFADGVELEKITKFRGLPVTAGYLIIDFERMGLLDANNRTLTCVDTTRPAQNGPNVSPQTFDITIDIDAAASAPAFELWAATSPGNEGQSDPRIFQKIRSHTTQVSATGDFEISDIVRSNVISGIMFDTSTVTFDNLEIEINGLKIIDAPTALLDHIQERGIVDPQADTIFFDFSYQGFGDRILNAAGAQDFRFRLNATATGALKYTMFYLGPLER